MSLVPCSDCGKTISSHATTCPHCDVALSTAAHELRHYRSIKFWFASLGAAVASVILGAAILSLSQERYVGNEVIISGFLWLAGATIGTVGGVVQ